MNKYMYKRLLFPEPADNGGGGGATEPATPNPAPAAPTEGGGGRFSLSGNPAATPPAATPPAAEYALRFEDGDGIDADFREFYTAAAKHADLPADAASKFVHDFSVRSAQYRQKAFADAEASLQRDWGRDFPTRVEQTAAFARRLCDAAGLSNEARAMFENPVAMRVFDALRLATSEGGAVGMGATQPPPPAKTAEEQIWELSKQIAEENNKPDSDFLRIQSLQQQIAKLAGLD